MRNRSGRPVVEVADYPATSVTYDEPCHLCVRDDRAARFAAEHGRPARSGELSFDDVELTPTLCPGHAQDLFDWHRYSRNLAGMLRWHRMLHRWRQVLRERVQANRAEDRQ